MASQILVEVDDVCTAMLDVLVLKHADAHHGVDLAVSRRMRADALKVADGQHVALDTNGVIAASHVLVLGVGPLWRFDYARIEEFAARTIVLAKELWPAARRVGITIHGPGYGLDELAAISNLVSGIERGLKDANWPNVTIVIVERDRARAERVQGYLNSSHPNGAQEADPNETANFSRAEAQRINVGNRLFSAMPFRTQFLDHWDLAIQPAAHANGLIVERLDHETFTGDIVAEIRARIQKSKGVVALLDGENPNVFLEIGYAWGVGRPTILAMSEGSEAPFDVRGQRILRYSRIGDLKRKLKDEIGMLAATGAL